MDSSKTSRRTWRWRSVVSLMTTWLFVTMVITGLILYVVPQGRIAYWVDWRFLALSKTDWGNIHIVSSILFVIAGGFHVYYNWRAFLAHMRRKIDKTMKLRTELFVTVATAVLIVASAIWHIPPLGYLVDLNEWIKDSWVENGAKEPPFGHAELLSVGALSKKTSIDVEAAMQELRDAGYEVESASQTLEQIAAANGVSPADVFSVMKKHERAPQSPQVDQWTPDLVLERFKGGGLGARTLKQSCQGADQKWKACQRRLENQHVQADADETMKKAAARLEIKPIKLLQMMLVDP